MVVLLGIVSHVQDSDWVDTAGSEFLAVQVVWVWEDSVLVQVEILSPCSLVFFGMAVLEKGNFLSNELLAD